MASPRRRPLVTLLAAVGALCLGASACSSGDDERGTRPSEPSAPTSAAAGEERPAEPNIATVEMTEYAFTVTGSLVAGHTTVALRNSGAELHMAGLALLKPGKTLADVQQALQAQDEAAAEAVIAQEIGAPGGLLSPGAFQEVTTAFLQPGSYALVCFIPSVGDGVPHFAKGMVATLDVAEGSAVVNLDADAEYRVGDGAIEGPATLAAGRRTLRVTGSGGGPHEFIVFRRRDPAATFEQLDTAFTALFAAGRPPPPGYADGLPAVIAASTFDMAPGSTIFVAVDLEPGMYFVGCAREPEEGEPGGTEHRELVEVTVT